MFTIIREARGAALVNNLRENLHVYLSVLAIRVCLATA
tara:strand:+ start:921 stop:1034 length:114 start_codon:yes stop_codon:yes gene_type:complete